ncbi:MAG: hypothetical protein J6W58_01995 [Lachnospiraceae bacterium]|nr:hypothetical protein [Lachnospiraceae bacterium]MBP5745058.1 hypothetical protein [Lachnospiraceae bacterium]
MKRRISYRLIIGLAIIMAVYSLSGCGSQNDYEEDEEIDIEEIDSDVSTDIDFDKLNESIDNINNLDLSSDVNTDSVDEEEEEMTVSNDEGDKTIYSFTDVVTNGNDITVVPNGGMNGSTVLANGKDLNGFLDYVDSNVLEQGRTIDRDLFYDLLAIMLVDKDLSPDFERNKKNMIMALAMANNFYGIDVKINDCYLDANNAAEYQYHVTAQGKDDTWKVNYAERTVFFNDGATEYTSDMFKDEYLAIWLVAIEEYYEK